MRNLTETDNKSAPLTDLFQRRLSYLRLSVTDLCNFKCNYCLPDGYQGKKSQNELTVSEIDNLVSTFADLGTKKIRLTGGEPTLRKDINEIIQVCQRPEHIEKVALTTNGWKLEQHYKKWIDSGLNQINISVDSLDEDTFEQITGRRSLGSILRAIDLIMDYKPLPIKLNAVLLKESGVQQLHSVLAFIKDKPISFRFIELMQTAENNLLFENSHLSASRIVKILEREGWTALPRGKDAGPAVEYAHPDYMGRMGVIAPYSKDFCKNCNRLRVTAMGNLHLCLFDSFAFNIRPYLADGKRSDLINYLQNLMPQKPEMHHLHENNSGLITNLSMIGG
ncbi:MULTISPECIES: GTP 3',8-cyclase MoaA [Pasteurellaceae]|uniref:GTP 3',8-cyclase MoaA n=1 Tax=Pasteurella atlantica TaxID=2827233 RepID=A0AAW8CG82_9PAST|nr:GTP 3',8-cyclase MoaA [Pasteurella atlantica]MBR0573174.1 GTP 3',8-cyclase MoaA [Pasteurella atlantica]MDP8039210.1 GTP 3',8-cyclase MoaA [Pasteurella atlantica]MDP8041191.1 GTP 3',8-cyclase MoaA [Pasteurella atlantica]MDP8043328.1 GTP 3',8-cyclase MoaA [Pasteurella atlantica]MDP8045414.1 GTP 3',8-cyclase MoaA [Pasteurella atlantica]